MNITKNGSFSDEEFMFMKESMYAKDLRVAFPKFVVVLQEYDLNKKKATPKQEPTAPDAKTQCGICSENHEKRRLREVSKLKRSPNSCCR
jgi:hypothetical protein